MIQYSVIQTGIKRVETKLRDAENNLERNSGNLQWNGIRISVVHFEIKIYRMKNGRNQQVVALQGYTKHSIQRNVTEEMIANAFFVPLCRRIERCWLVCKHKRSIKNLT